MISDGAGQVFEEVAPSVSLAVVPTLAEEDNELRDIKPQAGLNVPAAWPWIAGGLLLAVGLFTAWRVVYQQHEDGGRRRILTVSRNIVLVAVLVLSCKEKAQDKPNVLMICVDDLIYGGFMAIH